MPGRKYTGPSDYRFGFNGHERTNELNNDSYMAEYWQYDARIGRRWNVDPVVKANESPYDAFSNNPIIFVDPKGLDTVSAKGRRFATEGDVYRMKNGEYVTKGEFGWFTATGQAVGFTKDKLTAREKQNIKILFAIAQGSVNQRANEARLAQDRILEFKMAMTRIQNKAFELTTDATLTIATSGLGTALNTVTEGVFLYGKLGQWLGPLTKNLAEKLLANRGDFSRIDWFDVITSSLRDRYGLGLGGKVSVEVLNVAIDVNQKSGLQVALYNKDAGSIFIDVSASFIKTMLGDVLKELKSSKTTEQAYKIVIDQLKTTLKDAGQ